MARKKVFRTQSDVREYPSYGIDEVAAYIGVPKRTLRSWVSGYKYSTSFGTKKAPAIIIPADPKNNLLSFYNLVEAQVLATTRERHIGLRKVRRAIEFMREHLHEERPLLNCVFDDDGQEMFINQIAGEKLKSPLNVSRHGQYAFKKVLKRYLKRIERDAQGLPTQFSPIKVQQQVTKRTITINPRVSAGKPSIRGKGIMAEVIWNRKKAGESEGKLAKDFRLKPSEIKAAISYFAA
jgi:uncharacterized protein (DUF433 family)